MELTSAWRRPRGHERRRHDALISASGACSLSPLPNDMEPHLDALNLPRYFTHDG